MTLTNYFSFFVFFVAIACGSSLAGQESLTVLFETYAQAIRAADYEKANSISRRIHAYGVSWIQKDTTTRRRDMPTIVRNVAHSEPLVRVNAAGFLGTLAHAFRGEVESTLRGFEQQIIEAYGSQASAEGDSIGSQARDSLLRSLIFVQPLAPETEKFMTGLLNDPSVESRPRVFALFALAQSARSSDKAREVAIGSLQSSDQAELLTAMPMLAQLQNPDPAIVAEFGALLRRSDPEVVVATLSAVSDWGESASALLREVEMLANTATAPAQVRQQANVAATRIRATISQSPK